MINVKSYTPKNVSHFIKSYWAIEIENCENDFYTETMIPDGHFEIIFHLQDNAARCNDDSCSWIKEPTAFLTGQSIQPFSIKLQKKSKLYGVRFHPHTLALLVKFPLNEITEQILEIDSLRFGRDLKSCLSCASEETYKNFDRFFESLFSKIGIQSNSFQYIHHTINLIQQHRGDISVDTLLIKTGISGKYLDEIFKNYIGLTPKFFSTIIKVNHFITLKNENTDRRLIDCLNETNFYDQSHLIRTFRAITAKSPKDYFRDNNFINNHFLA